MFSLWSSVDKEENYDYFREAINTTHAEHTEVDHNQKQLLSNFLKGLSHGTLNYFEHRRNNR